MKKNPRSSSTPSSNGYNRASRPIDKTALIIFAREPKIGRVKTRLHTHLEPNSVLPLYIALVKDAIQLVSNASGDTRYIYFTGSQTAPHLRKLAPQFTFRRQQGKTLGDRLFNAFKYAHKNGARRMLAIGTDCPTMTLRDFANAFQKLSRHDYVLGPAHDGGYYLLGLTQPVKDIFQGISWGGPRVLKQTLHKISASRKKVALLRRQTDIDTYASLIKSAKLIEKRNTAPYTKSALDKILNASLQISHS